MGEFGRTASSGTMVSPASSTTVGWKPGCDCNEDGFPFPPVPCTVLDPFAGVGTTLLMAAYLGRWSIGIELNQDYREIIKARLDRWEKTQ